MLQDVGVGKGAAKGGRSFDSCRRDLARSFWSIT